MRQAQQHITRGPGTGGMRGFQDVFHLAVGEHLPYQIAHTGFTFERVVNFMFYSTEGILGVPLGVSATVIIVFVIFGCFLLVSGAGSFFIDLGLALFGRYRGGPDKAAVPGSCFFGMMTGSQVANVSAEGVLTIPLMKRVGYKPVVAASIEALASTGAMIMPKIATVPAMLVLPFLSTGPTPVSLATRVTLQRADTSRRH